MTSDHVAARNASASGAVDTPRPLSDARAMALRCARCQTNEVVLETFGIYRCPACGRVDADGRMLDPTPAPSAGAATFAAPPAREWIPPGAPAVKPTTPHGGAPPLFTAMIAVDAILIVVAGAMTGRVVRTFIALAFLVPLFTGKPWARSLALAGAGFELLAVCGLFAFLGSELPPAARFVLVVDAVVQLFWVYALVRPDTSAYFARRR